MSFVILNFLIKNQVYLLKQQNFIFLIFLELFHIITTTNFHKKLNKALSCKTVYKKVSSFCNSSKLKLKF